jgi:hypothetical protein
MALSSFALAFVVFLFRAHSPGVSGLLNGTFARLQERVVLEGWNPIIFDHADVENANIVLNCVHLTVIYPGESAEISLGAFLFSMYFDGIFAEVLCDDRPIGSLVPVFIWGVFAGVDDSVLLRLGEIRL